MKITQEHLQYMQTAIDAVIEKHGGRDKIIEAYSSGNIPRADKVIDLQKRLCFDLLDASNLTPWICDTLYSYVNDTHIYTALKVICPKVERKY